MVSGDRDDVAFRQRAQREVGNRKFISQPAGQAFKDRQVIARDGHQPRDGRASKTPRQRPEQEHAQVIQPLRVINRDDDRALRGAQFQSVGHRVQQGQGLASDGPIRA